MHHLIMFAFAVTLAVIGWGGEYPIALLIAGAYLGHVLTEMLNDPTL